MGQETVTVERAKAKRELNPVSWLFRKPMNLEKLALAAQRVSGLGMLVYLTFHIFVIGSVASGADVWRSVMSTFSNPFADIGDLLMIAGAAFHAVNGVRVLLLELTPLTGRPARPDYPYKAQSLGTGQRSIIYAAIFMAVLALVIATYYIWGH